jgi:hypothetical protein
MEVAEAVVISRARRLARSGEGRRIREEAGLTVREMSSAVGVVPATISRWERGLGRPVRGSAVRRWVRVLDRLHSAPGATFPGPGGPSGMEAR